MPSALPAAIHKTYLWASYSPVKARLALNSIQCQHNYNISVDPFLPPPFNITVRSKQRYLRLWGFPKTWRWVLDTCMHRWSWPVLLLLLKSIVWHAVQSCEVMKQLHRYYHILGLQHSSWSSSITYSHCNHLSLSVTGAQTLSVIHNKLRQNVNIYCVLRWGFAL